MSTSRVGLRIPRSIPLTYVLHRITMMGNGMARDLGIVTCGKNGQGVSVRVSQSTLRMERIMVGG